MANKIYDLIIIGSGPAGLTAAVYAARYQLNILVIGKVLGGATSTAWEICNFPSYGRISGVELIKKMSKQVEELGVEIKAEGVADVKKIKDGFEIKTEKTTYKAKKIIIATGTERKKLNLPNEEKLAGKGISYCATCDAGFYKNKVVGIVGGSDSALTAALLLTKFAKKVYIIYRQKSFFRAQPAWVEEVKKNKKIRLLFESRVRKLLGTKHITGVMLGPKKELKLDGLFVEIGGTPIDFIAKKLGVKMDGEYIAVSKKQKTNLPGVYAAGDITNNPLKQIVTACGEGAVAADTAYRDLGGGEQE